MVYLVRYQANFECPKGHRFAAEANPLRADGEERCMLCFEEWIAANVPNARQIDKAIPAEDGVLNMSYTMD